MSYYIYNVFHSQFENQLNKVKVEIDGFKLNNQKGSTKLFNHTPCFILSSKINSIK